MDRRAWLPRRGRSRTFSAQGSPLLLSPLWPDNCTKAGVGYRPLIRSNLFPYHVYARSNNRESFYISTSDFWDILIEKAIIVSENYKTNFHTLVLMPNHFHIILSTDLANLDEMMLYFQREISRSVNRVAGRINHVFGGPYKWSLIDNLLYFENATRYLYQNPVRAGLCEDVEGYPYSSFKPAYVKPLYVSCVPKVFENSRICRMNHTDFNTWLNFQPKRIINEYIAKSLKRKRFQLSQKCPPLP